MKRTIPWMCAVVAGLGSVAPGLGCNIPDRSLDLELDPLLPQDAAPATDAPSDASAEGSESDASLDSSEDSAGIDASAEPPPTDSSQPEAQPDRDGAQPEADLDGPEESPANQCDANTQTDPENCGTCQHSCSYDHAQAQCVSAQCQMGPCQEGFRDCYQGDTDGCETNTAQDPTNCGVCGLRCTYSENCRSASCYRTEPSCSASCQPSCTAIERWSVTDTIAVDYQNGKRLWQRADNPRSNFQDAQDYCESLTLDGRSGWRLPYSSEFETLRINCNSDGCTPESCCPCIDQGAFVSPARAHYWIRDTATGFHQTFDTETGLVEWTIIDSQLLVFKCTHAPL